MKSSAMAGGKVIVIGRQNDFRGIGEPQLQDERGGGVDETSIHVLDEELDAWDCLEQVTDGAQIDRAAEEGLLKVQLPGSSIG